MDKDADWLYRAISCPWLSGDPVNLVEISGRGFASVFDETRTLDATTSLSFVDYEFVGFWKPAFAGWNAIASLVFRKRAG